MPHFHEESVANIPATNVIIDNPYLDTLPHFINQSVCNEHAKWVIIKDVSIDMDVILGPSYGTK